jgi:hypothetical protein
VIEGRVTDETSDLPCFCAKMCGWKMREFCCGNLYLEQTSPTNDFGARSGVRRPSPVASSHILVEALVDLALGTKPPSHFY